MAANKKHSTLVCLLHVNTYVFMIALFTGWPWWALLITAVCHFIQDRTSIVRWHMHHMRQDQFATGALAPWSMIVVDNTLHLLQLHLTQKCVELAALGAL